MFFLLSSSFVSIAVRSDQAPLWCSNLLLLLFISLTSLALRPHCQSHCHWQSKRWGVMLYIYMQRCKATSQGMSHDFPYPSAAPVFFPARSFTSVPLLSDTFPQRALQKETRIFESNAMREIKMHEPKSARCGFNFLLILQNSRSRSN